jgi:hypothetical protein
LYRLSLILNEAFIRVTDAISFIFSEFVIGHKENIKKVGKVTNQDNEKRLQQFNYLREKVRRLVAARKKAREAKESGRGGFVTAVFRHVHDPPEQS